MFTTKFAVLILASGINCFCAPFCAVRVLVTDAAGRPASALVRLLDNAGRVVKEVVAENGTAAFCDFGFGNHSIEVGPSTCSHIIIPNVRVVFGRTLIFRVYRNVCGGDVTLLGCLAYFRVADIYGSNLAGVSLTSEPPGIGLQTDEYGRAQASIDRGDSRTLIFAKRGYTETRLSYECAKPAYMERAVILSPTGQ